MPTDEIIETMARAYAGAPFASKQAAARMKRALSAAEAAEMVMVPREPTEAMIGAGLAMESCHPEEVYAAMIEARP